MTDDTLFADAQEKCDPREMVVGPVAASADHANCQRIAGLLDEQATASAQADPAEGSLVREPLPSATPHDTPEPEESAPHFTRTMTPEEIVSHSGPDGHETLLESLTFLEPSQRPDGLGRIGNYEVLEILGQGGFGIVFRAMDEVLQRVVAVKVMLPQGTVTSASRRRFLREARSAAAVRHENVVQIHAIEEKPLPHLVMEFISGPTLQTLLNRQGPLPVEFIVNSGLQIARGLAAAHEMGLVHRDIKPANVLLEENRENRAKITDFGLARTMDDAGLTGSGLVVGTPMYMAPEQARGEPLDHRADLFSLGCLLYALCTGKSPFVAGNLPAVLKRVCDDVPHPLRELRPEVPPALCSVIDRLLAKDRAARYPSATAVADHLTRLLSDGLFSAVVPVPESAPTDRQPRGSRTSWPRWAGSVVAVGLVVLLLGVAYSVLYPSLDDSAPTAVHSEEIGDQFVRLAAADRWDDVDQLAKEAKQAQNADVAAIDKQWARVYFDRATERLRSREPAAALELLQRAGAIWPTEASALVLRAKIHEANENYQAAASDYLQAARAEPENAISLRREAAVLSALQARGLERSLLPAQARDAYAEALSLNPGYDMYERKIVDCTLDHSRALCSRKEFQKALNYLHSGQKLLSVPDKIVAKEIETTKEKERAEAITKGLFRESSDDHLTIDELLRKRAAELGKGQGHSIGLNAYRAQDLELAIKAFEMAIRLDGDDDEYKRNLAIAHNRMGNNLFDQGKFAEASERYGKAAEIQPKNATYAHNIGLSYSFPGKYAEAIVPYTTALELEPNRAETYAWRGEAYLLGKINYTKARADFDKALSLVPNDARSLNGIAMLLAHHPDVSKRNVQSALDFATRACADPKNLKRWEYLLTQASVYARNNEFEEALKMVEEAAKQPKALETVIGDLRDNYRNQLPPPSLPAAS